MLTRRSRRRTSSRTASWATAQIQELELRTVDPEAVEPTIVSRVEGHLSELEALEAHEGLARAWRLIMFVREMGLQWGASEAAAQHARPRAAGGEPADGGPRDPLARLLRPERADPRARRDRALPSAPGRGPRGPEAGGAPRGGALISRRCAATSRSPERCTGRAGHRWRSSGGRSWRRRRRSTPVRWRCSTATSRRRSRAAP